MDQVHQVPSLSQLPSHRGYHASCTTSDITTCEMFDTMRGCSARRCEYIKWGYVSSKEDQFASHEQSAESTQLLTHNQRLGSTVSWDPRFRDCVRDPVLYRYEREVQDQLGIHTEAGSCWTYVRWNRLERYQHKWTYTSPKQNIFQVVVPVMIWYVHSSRHRGREASEDPWYHWMSQRLNSRYRNVLWRHLYAQRHKGWTHHKSHRASKHQVTTEATNLKSSSWKWVVPFLRCLLLCEESRLMVSGISINFVIIEIRQQTCSAILLLPLSNECIVSCNSPSFWLN